MYRGLCKIRQGSINRGLTECGQGLYIGVLGGSALRRHRGLWKKHRGLYRGLSTPMLGGYLPGLSSNPSPKP